jgi:deoxyribose-phosphate aldolase
MLLNKLIDHTKLGFNVSKSDIDKLCNEAITYQFKSVCVNPIWVKYAKEILAGSSVLVCTVIGFPHGTHTTNVKEYEAMDAINNGADELDMVINVNALKSGDYTTTYNEIKAVVDKALGNCVKVILETCLLSDSEIIKAVEISIKAGATFVKTSTGFSTSGASIHAVNLMRDTAKGLIKVKASGGIRNYEDAKAFVLAGADRIGTSNGVIIVEGGENDTNTAY